MVGTASQRTVLVAPFDGTVAKIVGEVGEYSTPSPPGVAMPPAIDLIDESCLYVKAPMDEVDAPKIAVGQPVRITLDALPGRSFAGKVRRIAPYVTAVEKQARTVEIEVDFDDPQSAGRLLVGYSADVEVILDVRQRRAARAQLGAAAGRPRAAAAGRPADRAAGEDRRRQLGAHRDHAGPAGRRAHRHLAGPRGVVAGAAAVEDSTPPK